MSLSNIIESLGNEQPRMIELGKIKIGGLGESRNKAGGGTYRMPAKHDHFTVTTLNRSPAGDLVSDDTLMKKLLVEYGDKDGKLRQLPVRVMSNDLDDVLQSAWVWYGGKTCGARSDGKKITWFVDPKTRTRYAEPQETDWQPGDETAWVDNKNNPLFKLHSVFNCVIASNDARWGGVYKFRTTSIVTFKQLAASLTHIHQLTGGILIGMPLRLVVRPIQVAPEGKPTTVYVVHCEIRGAEMQQIQQQAMSQQAWLIENKQKMLTMQAQYRKLLVAPGMESAHETGDIVEEFQPEAIAIEPAPDKFDLIDGGQTETPSPSSSSAPSVDTDKVHDQDCPVESAASNDDLDVPNNEEAPEIDPLAEAYSQDGESCKRTLLAAAKKLPGYSRAVFDGGVFKYAHHKGVTAAKLAKQDWIALHRAIVAGAFDYASGTIRQLQTA